MLGAIIGDIVGSIWEFKRIKHKDFPLFAEHNTFTDDTIMTMAVADALLNNLDPATTMRSWARNVKIVPRGVEIGGYGQKFFFWLSAPNVLPAYHSFGNGGAMRVSPAAFLASSLDECLQNARRVTEVTHDHPEGLRGALATSHAIYLALQNEPPTTIRAVISKYYNYDLSKSVEEIRPDYERSETAQGSVPESLVCALEAKDYEDAIRNAVSLGGDTDTMAAIAGGLAEALFGIPDEIKTEGLSYLNDEMKALLHQFDRITDELRHCRQPRG